MTIIWSRLAEIIDAHERFIITSHIRPDGDAIGSELGMAALLDQKGKQSWIVNASELPERFEFLDPTHRILHIDDEQSRTAMKTGEVLIILDTSAWVQLGSMGDFIRNTSATKLVIDHHLGHDDMGAELFKDVHAPACGALLADAAEPLGCQLTPEVAEPLFVALATDTGWFRFSSTNGNTLRLAARLSDAGANVSKLYCLLFEETTLGRLKLMGRTLEGVHTTKDGRIAYSAIRLSDFQSTGAVPQDSEDLVNYTLSISGVQVGLLFIEQRSGMVKVSFRSRNGLDCTRVAAQFGGGGHHQAAGAMIDGPIEQAQSRVLEAVRAALDG